MTSTPSRSIRHRIILLACLAAAGLATAASSGPQDQARVSPASGQLPNGQVVTPAGLQVELPDMRPQVLALSPDGKLLVTSGRTHEIVVLDPATGRIRQRVPLPAEPPDATKPEAPSTNILKPDEKGQVSYTGLVFSPDGRTDLPEQRQRQHQGLRGRARRHGRGPRTRSPCPRPAPRAARRRSRPASPSPPTGERLYVALNLSNRLGEFDAADGRAPPALRRRRRSLRRRPRRGKAYVSNWGGRRPSPATSTGPAGRGTLVKVDPSTRHRQRGLGQRHRPRERARRSREIPVQLHASALALSPDGRYVVCANAASDTLSVIDARTDAVVETIWAKPSPADLFGASPNALAFDRDGQDALRRQRHPERRGRHRVRAAAGPPSSSASIPVGWFPGAIACPSRASAGFASPTSRACEPAGNRTKRTGAQGFNSHQYHGSLSLVPVPEASELPRHDRGPSGRTIHRERIAAGLLPPRPGQPPRPVPERIGEPSVFKHVVYIIKENRTYDQVLGDMPRGQRRPAPAASSARASRPTSTSWPREFVLLDNTYCCGILSADGHQWSTTAFGTDYLERSFAGWPRSYPDGMGEDEVDALAYAPTGFIWDNALRHGKTLRDYGEFAMPQGPLGRSGSARASRTGPTCWRESNDPTGEIVFGSEPAIESLRPYLATKTVGWNMEVPDAFRADYLHPGARGVREEGRRFPDLILICLPNDHTSGTSEGSPDAGRLRRRQRPGLRPHRRGPQPEPVLEGDRRLRDRGRSAGRLGPCQRLPDHGLCRQPLHEARRRSSAPSTTRSASCGRSSRSSACRR